MPLETGLALLAIGIDAVLAPTLTPWLVNRFGNVRVIFGGLLLALLAYVLFQPIGLDWTYAAMFPTMILLGTAFALVYGPLTIAANALAWAPQIRTTRIVRGAYAAAATSPIHQRDIAEVAVRALLNAEHAGHAYVLTGPSHSPRTTRSASSAQPSAMNCPSRSSLPNRSAKACSPKDCPRRFPTASSAHWPTTPCRRARPRPP